MSDEYYLASYDDGTTFVEITQPFIGHVEIAYGPDNGPKTRKSMVLPGRMAKERKVRIILDEVERLTGIKIYREDIGFLDGNAIMKTEENDV